MIDGARNALAGYLYQILAGAGLTARAVQSSEDQRGELFYSLIIEARNARVFHEMHEQDLMLRREEAAVNSGTAVQFKFSSNGAAEAVTPSELRDILRAFRRCVVSAAAEFPVTGFVLVTNRALGGKAREHYDRRAARFDDLKQVDRKWLYVPKSQRSQVEEEHGSVHSAAKEWYAVFQNLNIYENIGANYWLCGLRKYARARGLYDEEFSHALTQLVGDVFQTTIEGPAEFSRDWLNQSLLGSSNARSLELTAPPNDSARLSAVEFHQSWMKHPLGVSHQELVRRDYLSVLSDQLAQYPIVLVLGEGGCGKSTVAAQFLLESAL